MSASAAPYDTVICGGTVVSSQGAWLYDVAIGEGKIVALLESGSARGQGRQELDASGRLVLPGVVDVHAHVGFGGPSDWLTESASAALGGVTTLLNYVIGSESYLELVPAEIALAERDSSIDFGLHIVPCTERHLEEMQQCADEHGVGSFKYFMNFRGEEGRYMGVAGTDDGYLFEYLRRVAAIPGAVANVHPENIEVVWRLRAEGAAETLPPLMAWNATRPDIVEAEAAMRAAFYADAVGAPLYVVHVSGRRTLDVLRAARAAERSAPLYIETCPHYLTHTERSDIGTLGKVNPPLRTEDDVMALWDGVRDGTVDVIGSDHVSRHRSLKATDIWRATAGMPGTGSLLSTVFCEGVHKRGISIQRLVEVACENPTKVFGLSDVKGRIAPGYDADVVIFDDSATYTVDADTWGGAAGYNLYEGWQLRGRPACTMVRGRVVARDGEYVDARGWGRYLGRPSARATTKEA